MDKLKLPQGAIVHFHGMPFELSADTEVLGRVANLEFALRAHVAQQVGEDTQAVLDGVNVSGR